MNDIAHQLQSRISGEVRFDKYSRILYSTDASIYEIEPLGVVVPKSEEDIQATIELADKEGIPVIPRGGGTSLVGQSIGAGIIVDCSKYLNRVLEVNAEEGWARVQPGVVLDQLNREVHGLNLQFAPDTATSSRANLGGLIGNNSSGARSIVYGKTLDHVLELDVVLANGDRTRFTDISADDLNRYCKQDTLQGEIHRAVTGISVGQAGEIERRFPKIMRRVGGYNLDEFIKEQPFNLSRLIVGSEGTLAFVTGAKVKLVPLPPARVLGVLHFKSVFLALDAVTTILEFTPSAVELVDRFILNAAKSSLEHARRMTFIEGEPEAVLLVEFQGEEPSELADKLAGLITKLSRDRIGYAHVRALTAPEQADVWAVRKAGLGLLLGVKEPTRPTGFVEDTAVPTDKLVEYIRRFDEIIKAHHTTACFYAHASVGCLHIRPLLNLQNKEDVAKMHTLADAVSDLVLEYGGAMSAEHGDGLARSCFNEKMFGSQLYEAFVAVKTAFDPKNILNPGKIVHPQRLTDNLRKTTAGRTMPVQPFLDFSTEGGFQNAIEICNGNAVCRKTDSGTMCPSYMVSREEEHSTRGRANALRAVLTGRLAGADFTAKRMYDVLDLCLACKGCKAECPTNVDMAKIKYEFLYHYHQRHGLSLRDRMFGHISTLSAWGQRVAPVANWLLKSAVGRRFLGALGIDGRRAMPSFSRQSMYSRAARPAVTQADSRPRAALFVDTFMNYNVPEIGMACVEVLEAAGFAVVLPKHVCCGRPFLSKGMLRQARACAARNVEALWALTEQKIPIIGCEPSCLLTLRDEYPDLLPGDERVRALSANAFLVEEFLTSNPAYKERLSWRQAEKKLLLHGHCHAKAMVGINPTVSLLRLIPGAKVETVDSGCCGMAGAFGYETEHYDISLAIGERRLFPAVKEKDEQWEIVAPGISCRQQILHGAGRKARHPIEVIRSSLS